MVWGPLIGMAAGGIASAIGGKSRAGKLKRRQQQAYEAARKARESAISKGRETYKPYGEKYDVALTGLEELVTKPELATEAREARLERAAERRLPGLRAGQVSRGIYSSGPALAQEAEFMGGLESSIYMLQERQREQARGQLIGQLQPLGQQYLRYQAATPELPMEAYMARAAPYAQPGAMETLGGAAMQMGGSMLEAQLLRSILGVGGGGGGGGGGAFTGGRSRQRMLGYQG